MENSTGNNKNGKAGIQNDGELKKKLIRQIVKSAKSIPNNKKSAYRFVGDRIYIDDSEHEI